MMPEAEQVPGQHTAAAAAPASDATEQGAAHDATAANSAFCRICHEPAAPDNPLIRPCKCSGTIQHVHHNCQLVWLRRSRRRECEMCHTPFRLVFNNSSSRPAAAPRHMLVVLAAHLTIHTAQVLLFLACCWVSGLTWRLVLLGNLRQALGVLRWAATPTSILACMLQGFVLWWFWKALKLVLWPHLLMFGRRLLSQTYEDLGVWSAWGADRQEGPGQQQQQGRRPQQGQQQQQQRAPQQQQEEEEEEEEQEVDEEEVEPQQQQGQQQGQQQAQQQAQESLQQRLDQLLGLPPQPSAHGQVVGNLEDSTSSSSGTRDSQQDHSPREVAEPTARAPAGSGSHITVTSSLSHSSSSHGGLHPVDEVEGSSGDEENSQESLAPSSSSTTTMEGTDRGSADSPVAASAPAAGAGQLPGGTEPPVSSGTNQHMGTGAAAGAGQLPEDPVSPVSSATSQQMSSEAAAAPAGSSGSSSADDIDPDEAQRLQHLLATQQHLQQQQQQQQGQQLEGQQQAGAGQQLEERVEGSLFRAVLVLSGMLLILLARRTLRGVLQAMFVPLCIVLPSLLTGRTLLLVASWLLGTPANGIARSIASAPPTAAAAAAASVSHQQQAAPWLPITAPVVLLNWTLSSWERVQEYIRPHWMLPLSLADVTALTLGGAALCTLPWAFFVSFAIMTKHWGLEPGADTQQGLLCLAASCLWTSFRSFIKTADGPFQMTLACIISGLALDLFAAPLAGVSPYHHLGRLAQAPVVSALTHYLPGLALVILWLQLKASAEACLRPGALPLLNSAANRARQPWYLQLAFFAQLVLLAWLAVGYPVQLVKSFVPRLLPLRLAWYAQAPGTSLDVQLVSFLVVAVVRRIAARSHIQFLLKAWLLAMSLLLGWPDYLLKNWASQVQGYIIMGVSAGISPVTFVRIFAHPVGTLQWHHQQRGYWMNLVALAAAWVLTWAVSASCLLAAAVPTGRYLGQQLHLPTNNDLFLGSVGGVIVATSAYVFTDILCTGIVNAGLPQGSRLRRNWRTAELLLCGAWWFVTVGGVIGFAGTCLLGPWWQLPTLSTWEEVYRDVVLGAVLLVAAHIAAALVARHFPVRQESPPGAPLQFNRNLPWPMSLFILHVVGLHHLRWRYLRPLATAVNNDMWRLIILPSALQAYLQDFVPLPASLAWFHSWLAAVVPVYVVYGVWQRGVRCMQVMVVLLRARLSSGTRIPLWENVGGILEYSEPQEAPRSEDAPRSDNPPRSEATGAVGS